MLSSAPRLGFGVACALLSGLFWGFSGTCAQLLMDAYAIDPLWISSVRMIVSAAIFLCLAAATKRDQLLSALRSPKALAALAVYGLFGVLLMQVAYLETIKYTSAGMGTAFEQVGLIYIMLCTCIAQKRYPLKREITGIFLALLGMFILATQGDPSTLAVPWQGLAWGAVSAVAMACYTLMPARLLKSYGSFATTGIAMLIGGLASLPLACPWEQSVQFNGEMLFALASVVLIGTAGAYLLYMQGIKHAGPVRASLLCGIEAVAALFFSAVWLGDIPSAFDVSGCVAILLMVAFVTGIDGVFPRKKDHGDNG